MTKINAAITGTGAYVPDFILTNDELAKKVDTSDEWIMSRIGIKERRILEDGKGMSDMAVEAIKELFSKTGTKPEEVDLLICCTITPDMQFPATANVISDKMGILNAFSFDINAACSGFLFGLATGAKYIQSGMYKKIVIVGGDKMSSIIDYTNRNVSPIFGDGAGAVLLEPAEEGVGILDEILHTDGMGRKYLHQKAGGSVKPATHETIDAGEHYVFQDGRHVFKHAVTQMANVAAEMMDKHKLSHNDIAWLVPHQANLRIIDAVAKRMELPREKVMINIQKYGNTTNGTIPLLLNEWEKQLKKDDKLIIATFGAGFTWGSMYIKWAYDYK